MSQSNTCTRPSPSKRTERCKGGLNIEESAMATKDDVRRVLDIIYGRARGNRRITLRSTMRQSLAATRCDCLEQILPRFLPVQCLRLELFCVCCQRAKRSSMPKSTSQRAC